MRCCWAGLLCCRGTTLCRGGRALGIGGAMVCAEALNRVEWTMNSCVHLCTQGALGRTGFRRHRRRDRRALLSMWETRTSEGTGGPKQKIEDRQLCGKWRSLRQTKCHRSLDTSSFYWIWQMFVAGLSVGSAPVLFLGRGRHGRIRRQSGLTWVCWWWQETKEEVLLCRAATAGHNFFFFGAVGKGNIEVKTLEAGTML